MHPRSITILGGFLLAAGLIHAQVPLTGLSRLTRAQAKAQGRSLVLDGSIPIQDAAGTALDSQALLERLQGGAHTVDLYVDGRGEVKVLVVRPKTDEEKKAPRSTSANPEPLPVPTADDIALVEATEPRVLMERMLEDDQGHREKAMPKEWTPVDAKSLVKGALAMNPATDARNQRLLMAFVERKGWPTRALVGEKGMMGAFLVLQHAPATLQERWLPQVQSSVARGDLPASAGALLEDRILMHQGKPQRHGTQSVYREGRLWVWPIAEPETLDARRKAVGLPTLAEQLQPLGLTYPKDAYPLEKMKPGSDSPSR